MIDTDIFNPQEFNGATSFHSNLLYLLKIPPQSIILCQNLLSDNNIVCLKKQLLRIVFELKIRLEYFCACVVL